MLIVNEFVLVFVAFPVVASPPLVLFVTVALPDDADCWLLVVKQMLLSLLTLTELLVTLTTLLSEYGPLMFMEPVLFVLEVLVTLGIVLVTETEALSEFVFVAAPVWAPPPVVLVATTAVPEADNWLLLLDKYRWLSLFTFVCDLLTDTTLLLEYGPVLLSVPELAPAIPAVNPVTSPSDVAATAAARKILLFTILPPSLATLRLLILLGLLTRPMEPSLL